MIRSIDSMVTERDKKRGGKAWNARLFLGCLYGEGVCCWATRDFMRDATADGEHRINGSRHSLSGGTAVGAGPAECCAVARGTERGQGT